MATNKTTTLTTKIATTTLTTTFTTTSTTTNAMNVTSKGGSISINCNVDLQVLPPGW